MGNLPRRLWLLLPGLQISGEHDYGLTDSPGWDHCSPVIHRSWVRLPAVTVPRESAWGSEIDQSARVMVRATLPPAVFPSCSDEFRSEREYHPRFSRRWWPAVPVKGRPY